MLNEGLATHPILRKLNAVSSYMLHILIRPLRMASCFLLILLLPGCSPYRYMPSMSAVTNVAAKGEVEAEGTLALNSDGYTTGELNVTAAPGTRLLLSAVGGYGALSKTSSGTGFYSSYNNHYAYNLLRAGAGLGTYGHIGNVFLYAQAGANYEHISTLVEDLEDYQSGAAASSRTQGSYIVPWQQVSLRYQSHANSPSKVKIGLHMGLRASQMIWQSYQFTASSTGNTVDPIFSEDFFTTRTQLVTQLLIAVSPSVLTLVWPTANFLETAL